MENNEKKKTLVSTIVAVVTLIALVAGATYAYFAVGTNTEGFTTQNINANAESVGNVILTKTGNGIYLNLSRVNMMKQGSTYEPIYQYDCEVNTMSYNEDYEGNIKVATLEQYGNDKKLLKVEGCEKTGLRSTSPTCESGCHVANQTVVGQNLIGEDVTYYGVDTPTGSPVTTMNRIPIGTATVTGDGYYTCTYSLTVTNANSSAANNMYTAFQEWKANGYRENNIVVSPSSDATTGQIVLNVGGTEYDFYNANIFNTKATGTLENITSENAKTIEAYMYVKNDGNKNQNAIAGTEINIEVTVDSFNCTAVNTPPRIEYWTLETGQSEVRYDTAIPKYTEANKSSIPNDYYIKSAVISAVATEDIYEIQYEYNGETQHFGQYVGLSACEAAKEEEGDTCVKLYSKGDTYDAQPTHEVCAKINGQEVCIEPNHWDTADETYKVVFEGQTIGWQCKYNKSHCLGNSCWSDTKPSNGSLVCAASDPSNLASGSFYCNAYSDGSVSCAVKGEARCDVYYNTDSDCSEQ